MTKLARMWYCIPILAVMSGCGLLSLLVPSTVTVRLVNNGSFPVEGELYYGDQQFTIKALLKESGDEVTFNIPAGDTQTIIRDCDVLQAIYIDDARLRAILLRPDDESDLLQDGTDFGCGDTITFTFSHSAILTDFRISTAVSAPTIE